MKIRTVLFWSLAAILLFSLVADAKVIRPSAEKGENKVTIQADGLACFFCAYGMERFFKQSGRIAWYDMDMKEGLVELGFIKGKPILPVATLKQYVYDAGFSPREIKAELVGRLVEDPDGSLQFEVSETAQRFPLEANRIVEDAQGLIGQEVTLLALSKATSDAPFLLRPERIVPKRSDP
ncbi:MAG: hypothetical protein ACE5F7_10215 [Nitrospiria bacterium]